MRRATDLMRRLQVMLLQILLLTIVLAVPAGADTRESRTTATRPSASALHDETRRAGDTPEKIRPTAPPIVAPAGRPGTESPSASPTHTEPSAASQPSPTNEAPEQNAVPSRPHEPREINPTRGGSLWPAAAPPPAEKHPRKHRTAAPPAPHEPGQWLIASPSLDVARQREAALRQLGWRVRQRQILKGLGLVVTTFGLPEGMTPDQAQKTVHALDPETLQSPNHRYEALNDADVSAASNPPPPYHFRLLNWPEHKVGCGSGTRIGVLDGTLTHLPDSAPHAQVERRSFLPAGVQPGGNDHAQAIATLLIHPQFGLVPSTHLFWGEVLRQRGEHTDTRTNWLLAGLNWLALQKVQVISISLGGPRNALLGTALDRLSALDVVIVAAAGNDGPRAAPRFPASHPGVIGVTAVDARKRIFVRANQGEGVDIAAPGVDLWLPREDGWAYQSGTSFATPQVAAVFAQIRVGHAPDATRARTQLFATAEDLGPPGPDTVYGRGLARLAGPCHPPP